MCIRDRIDPERLGVIISLVEHKAQGLFSAYGEDLASLPKRKREGYVPCNRNLPKGRYCASEIRGSEIPVQLELLDFVISFPEFLKFDRSLQIEKKRQNAKLPPEDVIAQRLYRHWEVSDQFSNISVSLKDQKVNLTGNLMMVTRNILQLNSDADSSLKIKTERMACPGSNTSECNYASKVEIREIYAIKSDYQPLSKDVFMSFPEELQRIIVEGTPDFSKPSELTSSSIDEWFAKYMQAYESSEEARQEILNGIRLIQELAMFRAVKENNPDAWKALLNRAANDNSNRSLRMRR